jgi:shikimate kinase
LRGIASDAGQSYAQIFAERTPLYQRYADITVGTDNTSPDQIAADILENIGAR